MFEMKKIVLQANTILIICWQTTMHWDNHFRAQAQNHRQVLRNIYFTEDFRNRRERSLAEWIRTGGVLIRKANRQSSPVRTRDANVGEWMRVAGSDILIVDLANANTNLDFFGSHSSWMSDLFASVCAVF